jgi:hypothetical protein
MEVEAQVQEISDMTPILTIETVQEMTPCSNYNRLQAKCKSNDKMMDLEQIKI